MKHKKTDKIISYTKNKDYEYWFPYGLWDVPQIKILNGKYKGLSFDITSSGVVSIDKKNSLNYDYRIINVWDDLTNFDGKNVPLNPELQSFISNIVYCFIKQFNKDQKREVS